MKGCVIGVILLVFIFSTLFFGILGVIANFGIVGFIFGSLLVISYQLNIIIDFIKKSRDN